MSLDREREKERKEREGEREREGGGRREKVERRGKWLTQSLH